MHETEFDYVIVGAGSSGSVVASRLSEDPDCTVCVIEAGPANPGLWGAVPLGFPKVLGNPRFMWPFQTEAEPCLNGRNISAARGKVLGGSSAVNGMVYVRGSPLDYSLWRQLGAEGWSYDDVLPYFRKAERRIDPNSTGPLGVMQANWRNPLADAFIAAGNSIGLPVNHGFHGPDISGIGYYDLSVWKGRRSSTAKAYLEPARGRQNLHIETEAQVSRIEFSARAAEAIVYEKDGTLHRVRARREIVLSAGSISTPHLLQLSGVGPASLLRSHGVGVVHNLPGVGENLSDHISARRVYTTSSHSTINAMMSSRVSQGLAGLKYLLNRSGPLSIGAALAGGYASTEPGLDAPDIQMFFIPFNADSYSGKLLPASSFQIIGYRNHPESRGNVMLQSADPRQAPKIVANYLSAGKDMATTVAALRLIDRIGKAEPLRKLNLVQIEPVAGTDSDAELEAYIRETATTGFHQVGTCRMGTDNLAVVDPTLKVHGIEKLRIADGSVMPTLISGNTNSVCIMIGEKCADLISNAM